MSTPLKIIIVDDHASFRDAFKFYMERKLNHQVIFECGSAQDFLSNKNIYEADIIFMDIDLPDGNGIELGKQLLRTAPQLKLIAISMYEDLLYLTQVIAAGFKGAMFKSNFYTVIENGINEVMHNKLFFPKNIKL